MKQQPKGMDSWICEACNEPLKSSVHDGVEYARCCGLDHERPVEIDLTDAILTRPGDNIVETVREGRRLTFIVENERPFHDDEAEPFANDMKGRP